MSSETTFRSCRVGDLARVQELVDVLYREDHHDSITLAAEIERTFLEFMMHPAKGRIVIFESLGQIVGYAICVFFWSNEYGGNIIEIDELVVSDASRGLGIGTGFFEWLQKEYEGHYIGLSLQVSHSNLNAQRLYERLGFNLSPRQHLIKLLTRSKQPVRG